MKIKLRGSASGAPRAAAPAGVRRRAIKALIGAAGLASWAQVTAPRAAEAAYTANTGSTPDRVDRDLQVDGRLGVGDARVSGTLQLAAALGENTPRLIVYDDSINASYLTYGVDALTRHKATSGWLWQTVPTGTDRLTAGGTIRMALSANGDLTLAGGTLRIDTTAIADAAGVHYAP